MLRQRRIICESKLRGGENVHLDKACVVDFQTLNFLCEQMVRTNLRISVAAWKNSMRRPTMWRIRVKNCVEPIDGGAWCKLWVVD